MGIARFLIPALISGAATADVMNLNEFMPTRMEDSKVIQAKSIEFQVSADFQKETTDESLFRENIRYGATDRLQIEAMADQLSGGGEDGNGELEIGGQYDITPQVGISPMIVFPTGKNQDGLDTHLRLNQSSTIIGSVNTPTLQFHINVDWAHNSQHRKDERTDHNLYVMGVSYKFNDSGALLIDLVREEEQLKSQESNVFEIGTQYDIGSEYLVGVGGGLGFGDESPHWNGILSLVKQVSL